jgi:hypothetical protein
VAVAVSLRAYVLVAALGFTRTLIAHRGGCSSHWRWSVNGKWFLWHGRADEATHAAQQGSIRHQRAATSSFTTAVPLGVGIGIGIGIDSHRGVLETPNRRTRWRLGRRPVVHARAHDLPRFRYRFRPRSRSMIAPDFGSGTRERRPSTPSAFLWRGLPRE